MLDRLKLPGSLFFILYAFIFTVSSQTLTENSPQEKDSAPISLNEPNLKNKPAHNPFAVNFSGEKVNAPKPRGDDSDANEEESLDWKLRRGDKSFTVEYGISPLNPSNFAGPKEFDVYGRDLHLFTFRFGRIIGTKKNVSYEYMFGATPLFIFRANEVVNKDYISPTVTPNIAPTKRETSYGTGFQPVNFKFMFFAKNRLKPYIHLGAGIMVTNKAVPVPRSTLFQLTGDWGGGLTYMLTKKRAVSLGYKYFHISNGNINGKINNPGFNANVFYINYSFWRR
jgi:hypothetical protein